MIDINDINEKTGIKESRLAFIEACGRCHVDDASYYQIAQEYLIILCNLHLAYQKENPLQTLKGFVFAHNLFCEIEEVFYDIRQIEIELELYDIRQIEIESDKQSENYQSKYKNDTWKKSQEKLGILYRRLGKSRLTLIEEVDRFVDFVNKMLRDENIYRPDAVLVKRDC